MTIFFQNDGVIDLDTIRTMGVSVKETDNPIGYFGTGLKFAIATLLRNDLKVELWVGTERIQFSTKEKSVRGKDFSFVMMGEEQLAFTTDLGKDWEVWQAYRELHSNCLDEIGRISRVPGEFDTTFAVSGQAIEEVYNDRHQIFLPTEPSWVVDQLEVHRGSSEYLYYRGVRVAKLPKKTTFTYNFLMPMKLTEDRTLQSQWDALYKISTRAPMIPDPEYARKALDPEKDTIESELDFNHAWAPSSEFLDVVESLQTNSKVNQKAVTLLKAQRKEEPSRESVELSLAEIMTVNSAISMLSALNCDLVYEDVTFVETLGQNIQGAVLDERIYISRDTIAKGTEYLASTLFEEWIHKVHGHKDCTRSMQQFLFDKIFQLLKEIK